MLKEEGAPERTVFHCYSGDAEMARDLRRAGYFMSFAGNVTFKNAQNLRDALAVAPPELVLVETDAPFLTPAPYRGRPNAPYLMPVTVRAMAAVRGVDEDALAPPSPPTRHARSATDGARTSSTLSVAAPLWRVTAAPLGSGADPEPTPWSVSA